METIKTHWNSVIYTPGAKYCTGDISNMYLCSTLDEPEFVKFRWDMIPPRIRVAYDLAELKQGDYVYARIKKAWYGLKQSGKIAHDDLVDHLQQYGYHKAPHTEGLFLHDERDISFTLVVDDFGIKYTQQEGVDHLVEAVGAKYTFKVDWSGKQYVGVHLNWDYNMFEVATTKQNRSSGACSSKGGALIATATSTPSSPVPSRNQGQCKEDEDTTTKPTRPPRRVETTEITTLYRANDMILRVDSNAAYLVCPGAKSRAGGYHYLGDVMGNAFNGPILVSSDVIRGSSILNLNSLIWQRRQQTNRFVDDDED
eukprot:jgi/Psemu1/30041/gm1.30041_g